MSQYFDRDELETSLLDDLKTYEQTHSNVKRKSKLDREFSFQSIIDDLKKSTVTDLDSDYDASEIVEKIVKTDFTNNEDYYHNGYLQYLLCAWVNHLGIEVGPWNIWMIIIWHLKENVKDNPSKYDHLWKKNDSTVLQSQTSNKKRILVNQDSDDFDINVLMEHIKKNIPENTINSLILNFDNEPKGYQNSLYGMIATISNVYYEFFIYCCNIPRVEVQGDLKDWEKLSSQIYELSKVFKSDSEYLNKVSDFIQECISHLDYEKEEHQKFWKDFFYIERCGSGSQQAMGGNIKKLFISQEWTLGNFPNISSKCNFHKVDSNGEYTERNYITGLLSSKVDDNMLRPQYNEIITCYDITKPDQKTINETNDLVKCFEFIQSCSEGDRGILFKERIVLELMQLYRYVYLNSTDIPKEIQQKINHYSRIWDVDIFKIFLTNDWTDSIVKIEERERKKNFWNGDFKQYVCHEMQYNNPIVTTYMWSKKQKEISEQNDNYKAKKLKYIYDRVKELESKAQYTEDKYKNIISESDKNTAFMDIATLISHNMSEIISILLSQLERKYSSTFHDRETLIKNDVISYIISTYDFNIIGNFIRCIHKGKFKQFEFNQVIFEIHRRFSFFRFDNDLINNSRGCGYISGFHKLYKDQIVDSRGFTSTYISSQLSNCFNQMLSEMIKRDFSKYVPSKKEFEEMFFDTFKHMFANNYSFATNGDEITNLYDLLRIEQLEWYNNFDYLVRNLCYHYQLTNLSTNDIINKYLKSIKSNITYITKTHNNRHYTDILIDNKPFSQTLIKNINFLKHLHFDINVHDPKNKHKLAKYHSLWIGQIPVQYHEKEKIRITKDDIDYLYKKNISKFLNISFGMNELIDFIIHNDVNDHFKEKQLIHTLDCNFIATYMSNPGTDKVDILLQLNFHKGKHDLKAYYEARINSDVYKRVFDELLKQSVVKDNLENLKSILLEKLDQYVHPLIPPEQTWVSRPLHETLTNYLSLISIIDDMMLDRSIFKFFSKHKITTLEDIEKLYEDKDETSIPKIIDFDIETKKEKFEEVQWNHSHKTYKRKVKISIFEKFDNIKDYVKYMEYKNEQPWQITTKEKHVCLEV